MDQTNPETSALEATPIFTAYRRGYDPVQVDRYVGDQQRRLDEALTRAGEAERKLAAAVGQLRELHRRVAVLESEDRSPQPAPLDALGDRVQRILQEAWEGAYALRQQAETEVAAIRAEIAGESAATLADAEQRASALVADAERRASAIDAEIERRRTAWNARLEEDRAKAVAQIAHLHAQRSEAVGELLRLRGMIEKAVQDLGGGAAAAEGEARLVAPEPASAIVDRAWQAGSARTHGPIATPRPATEGGGTDAGLGGFGRLDEVDEVDEVELPAPATSPRRARRPVGDELPVRVQRPRSAERAVRDDTTAVPVVPAAGPDTVAPAPPGRVFDFEEEQHD